MLEILNAIPAATLGLFWLLVALLVIWYDHRTTRSLMAAQRRQNQNNAKALTFMAKRLIACQKKALQERKNREYLEKLMEVRQFFEEVQEEAAASVELENKPDNVVVAWAKRPGNGGRFNG